MLVGVVMFVLALTILGLSLFSLSSYESQFITSAMVSDEAFYAAQSGMDHAKFVIAKDRTLSAVRTSLFPQPEVVYACAARTDTTPPDSTGSIDTFPPGAQITIRVLANVAGTERMVQGTYRAVQPANLYKRLISVDSTVYVKDSTTTESGGAGAPLCAQTSLQGVILASAGVDPAGCFVNAQSASLPHPDVAGFFAVHWASATPIVPDPSDHFTLSGPSNLITYYKSVDTFANDYFNIWSNKGSPEITVNGLAIWLVPRGIRFDKRVHVSAGPGDCLVIVASPGTSDEDEYTNTGIWFFSSLSFGAHSTQCPVILVSDGRIQIENFYSPNADTDIDYLSLFAHKAWIGGPRSAQFRLAHPIGAPEDALNGIIDRLCDAGALPNSETGGMRFQGVAGRWKELDPSDPPRSIP